MKRHITLIIALTLFSIAGFAQTAYRSVASGNWNAIATWERYNGTSWAAATVGQIPGATDSVYIQTGHNVALTQNESCGDLNLHNASSARLNLAGYVLNVNGKLGSFNAVDPTNFFPVTYNATLPSTATWINTSTAGSAIRIVGSTRIVANSGQWGANPASWNIEFALNVGQTATLNTNFKAGRITILSGNVTASNDLRPDGGAANTGDLIIASGAYLKINGQLSRTGTFTNAIDTVDVSGTLEMSGTGTPQNFSAVTLNINNGGVFKRTNPNALTTTITNLNWRVGSMLEYAATANQTVGGEFPATAAVRKVRINNTATNGTVTFPGSRTILDTLILNEGNIVIPSTDSLILGTSATANLQRVTGTIIGKLNRYISASTTGNVLFPVGSATYYRPVNANFVAAPAVAGNVSISHNDAGANSAAITSYTDGTYTVDRVSQSYWTGGVYGGFTAANITLSVDMAGQNGIANAAENRIAGSADGGATFGVPGGTHSTGSGTSAFRTGFQAQAPLFFRLYLAGNSSTNPLPVKYNSLTVSNTANANVVKWTTASEQNNAHFNIERSLNGAAYEVIGLVKGAGNTNKVTSYAFTDVEVKAGTACYRLNQVDFNGASELSKAVCVTVEKVKEAAVSTTPNPFNDKISVAYTTTNASHVTFEVIDMIGKVHYASTEQVKGEHAFTVNTAAFPQGVYFIRITNGNEVKTQRIIKK